MQLLSLRHGYRLLHFCAPAAKVYTRRHYSCTCNTKQHHATISTATVLSNLTAVGISSHHHHTSLHTWLQAHSRRSRISP